MRLELEVLDGPNKGKRLLLKNGLTLGKAQTSGLSFTNDNEMAALHAVVGFDSKKTWNIECLAPAKMRLGFEEVERASLILGLIFHLGQTGFKVVERAPRTKGPWLEELKDWLEASTGRQTSTEIFFFLRPVRLSFIQGAQYEEVYTLSYGPREIGFNSLDLNIKDPNTPPRVVKFFQIGDQVYIESLCGDKVTVNGSTFDQHQVSAGDILRVSSSVIELSFL
ncbi:MAG: hypothetical protein ABL930_01460 [Pseudobdellovibrio sp.]